MSRQANNQLEIKASQPLLEIEAGCGFNSALDGSETTATGSRLIPLTQEKFAIVDEQDYPELNKHKWCAHKRHYSWYAHRAKNYHDVSMHREILGLKLGDGKEVDHRNGNGLDNRRCNLRLCTNSENQQNQKNIRKHSSKFKGVSWNKQCKKWEVTICYEGKNRRLGYFDDEVIAAKIYDKTARELFGEFACLNFPLFGYVTTSKSNTCEVARPLFGQRTFIYNN